MEIGQDTLLALDSDVVIFDTETGGLHATNVLEFNLNESKNARIGDKLTGTVVSPSSPILEIAAVRLNQFTLQEIDSFHTLCGPDIDETIEDLKTKCTEEALKVNGFGERWDELAAAPPISKALLNFKDWATKNEKEKHFIPAGQNVRFDIEMLNAAWKKYGIDYQIWKIPLELTSYTMIYFALPDTPIPANLKLTTCAEALGISVKGAHQALEDVRMTGDCLRHILKRFSKI